MPNQTLMCTAPGEIAWVDVPDRPLESGEIRLANRFGAEKHGTMHAIVRAYGDDRGQMDEELGIYFGTGVAWQYPIPLGNMNYGEVIESRSDLAVGTTVVALSPFQAESIVRATDAFVVPSGLNWKTAFLQDPGEFGIGALRDGNVRIGDHVAIFSLGAIGLTLVQLAKAAGAERVIAIDPVASRREAALLCGADVVLGEDLNDLGWQIRQHSRRAGIDVVIDFSGAVSAMQAAFRALAPLGTLVLGAYPNATQATIDFGRESHHNQLNIVFTRACSAPLRDHPRWDWHRIRQATWHAVTNGTLNGEPIVDDPVPFEGLLEAYRQTLDDPRGSIKLAVEYPAR
jgi:threonine dehydrogenase-like Zn-dependent dehydrogenase